MAKTGIDNQKSDGAKAAKRGRPTGDHGAKRAELLKAATTVIAEQGFANASLRRVGQQAGCTAGAVNYYFANKEELVRALMESRFDHYDAMLESVRESTDVQTLVEQWLTTTTGDAEFWPVMTQLLAHAQHEPELAEMIERRYARYRERYALMLAKGQAAGTIRDDIPAEFLADQLVAMGDGWTIMYPFEPRRFTPKRIAALSEAATSLVSPR